MSIKLPPLLGLRVFECVARHRNFTRAANELCVTQAAVSHQIKALEEWMGAPLFHRSNRSITLTELGESLVAPVAQAFESIAASTNQALSGNKWTYLTVAVFDSFASAWIVPRLERFRLRFPEVNVRFIAKRLEVDALLSGDADVEIRYGVGGWSGLEVEKLLHEAILPVCASSLIEAYGSPDRLQDVADMPLLHDTFLIDWTEFLSRFGIAKSDTRKGYGFTHSDLVKRACIQGLGVALGRWPLVVDEIVSGELVAPVKEKIKLEEAYYVVCRKSSASRAEVKAFVCWLIDEAEAFTTLHKAILA